MDHQQLVQIQSNYKDELSQHQLSWQNAENVFEEATQQWQDQSAKSFIAAYLDQMQVIVDQMHNSLNNHHKALSVMTNYFHEIEVDHKELRYLSEMFLSAVEEQNCLSVRGKGKLVRSRDDAELALEKVKAAEEIIQSIK